MAGVGQVVEAEAMAIEVAADPFSAFEATRPLTLSVRWV